MRVANTSVRVPACASARACCGAIHRPSTDSRAVVRAELADRRRHQEEMRVEALGHPLRRDPVRERHHQVGGEHQVLAADDVGEGRLAFQQARAVRLNEPVAPHRRR